MLFFLWLFVCVQGCMRMYTHMYGGKKPTLSVVPQIVHTVFKFCFSQTGSFLGLVMANWAKLASK